MSCMLRMVLSLLVLLTLSSCSSAIQPDWQTAEDVVAMLKDAGTPNAEKTNAKTNRLSTLRAFSIR